MENEKTQEYVGISQDTTFIQRSYIQHLHPLYSLVLKHFILFIFFLRREPKGFHYICDPNSISAGEINQGTFGLRAI